MIFQTTANQAGIFVWFFLLGAKCGLEQKIFNLIEKYLTNKVVKVLKVFFNIIVIVLNCAQFYFLALNLNFGDIRAFMFLSFFLGFSAFFGILKLLTWLFKRLKQKKSKV